LYDLAQTFLGLVPPQRTAFLEGYRSKRRLPDNYKWGIEMFFAMACIENVSFHADNPAETGELVRRAPFIQGILEKYLAEKPFLFAC
jgi:Ser/Thr protein kinase RdoA (MazF antagonist)